MLADELVRTYRMYKEDTDYVASWLATTAKACGYTLDSRDDRAKLQGTGRLKGKARREAKQAAEQNQSATQQHTVAIKDFVPLAQYIVSRQPAVPVPESLAAALRRSIKLRGNFGGILQKHGYDLNILADQAHEHFVGVLAKVCNILGPRMSFNVNSPDGQANSAHDPANFANYFSQLSVEEPSESFLKAPDIILPDSRSQGNGGVQYIAEQQTSLDDALFALKQAYKDIITIRSWSITTWNSVLIHNSKNGRCLTSAALMISLGIDLVRDLFEEIDPLCDKYGGILEVFNILFQSQAAASGLSEQQMWESTSVPNLDNVYKFQEDFYFMPLSLLDEYRVQLSKQPSTGILWLGDFDSNQVFPLRAAFSGKEKHRVDLNLLRWYFIESQWIARKWGGVAEDEVIKGMRDLGKTPTVPFHLAFAGQVFLDIHHQYGEKITRAFDLMIQELVSKQRELQAYLEFQPRHPNNTGPSSLKAAEKKRHDTFSSLSKDLDNLISDTQFDERVDFYRKQNLPAPRCRHEFLRRNPVLCGLTLFYFQTKMNQCGFGMINADPGVIASCHLYNALEKEKLLSKGWPDLELLMMILGPSNLFVGEDRPEGLDNCYRNFVLQIGAPASAFASDRRGPRRCTVSLKPRMIPEGAKILRMFTGRYILKQKTEPSNWSGDYIQTFLDMGDHQELGGSKYCKIRVSTAGDKRGARARKIDQAKKRASGPPPRMSIFDLFMSLESSLQADNMDFTFPYLTVTRTAWECLGRVTEACVPLINDYFPDHDYKPGLIDRLIEYIFRASIESLAPHGPDPKILQSAARAMNEFMSSQLADEATRHNRNAGWVSSMYKSFLVHRYFIPPRPSEEDIAEWRVRTHTEDLFTQTGVDSDKSEIVALEHLPDPQSISAANRDAIYNLVSGEGRTDEVREVSRAELAATGISLESLNTLGDIINGLEFRLRREPSDDGDAFERRMIRRWLEDDTKPEKGE